MISLAEPDDFSPKKIADDLFERCKQAKAWYVYCYIEEEWISNGVPLPFDMRIVDGIVGCKVVCTTYSEAQTIVANVLPVIKFIEDPEIDNE
jgi:hypothetical protein